MWEIGLACMQNGVEWNLEWNSWRAQELYTTHYQIVL